MVTTILNTGLCGTGFYSYERSDEATFMHQGTRKETRACQEETRQPGLFRNLAISPFAI